MPTATYQSRRGELFEYFDRTAVHAWSQLTSDAPVNRIRATVRAGRDEMRRMLLSWLPADLHGCRILDAGCGTGALAMEAADRGADVVAVDLSPTLVKLAIERQDARPTRKAVDFRVSDMLDPRLDRFDYVIAMDSLIHYRAHDVVRVLADVTSRTSSSVLFTFAPRTAALSVMHAVGRMFPRGDRAPAIEPVREQKLISGIASDRALTNWQPGRTQRVSRGFYISQALEVTRK